MRTKWKKTISFQFAKSLLPMNYYDYACCWTRLDNFSVLILPKDVFLQKQFIDTQHENDAQQHKLVLKNLFVFKTILIWLCTHNTWRLQKMSLLGPFICYLYGIVSC